MTKVKSLPDNVDIQVNESETLLEAALTDLVVGLVDLVLVAYTLA